MTLTELFDEHHIRYWRAGESKHVTEGWLGTDCPMCSPNSGKGKLGWNLKWGICNCWTCGKFDRLTALVELTGQNVATCVRFLKQLEWDSPEAARKTILGKLVLPHGLVTLQKIHRTYLRGRGFDPGELVKLWGLMGIGLSRQFAWRIFIPIHHQGRMVSWTSRAVSDDNPQRYIAAEASQEVLPAKSVLYGMDYVRHAVVITEGPTDVWKIGPGAVATLGTSFTRSQLAHMSKYPTRVVCFDSEPAAQQRAKQLCEALAVFPGQTHRVQLDSADPGSASEREIKKLRQSFLE